MRAPALDVEIGGIRVRPVAVTGHVVATDKDLEVTAVKARASDGTFTGAASLPGYDGYYVEGQVEGLALSTALERSGNKPLGYSAVMAGPLRLMGTWDSGLMADADLVLTPAEGGVPLAGQVAVRYDKAAKQVILRNSYVTTPHSRLDIAGTLQQTLQVKYSTTNLDDTRPALSLPG